MGKKQISMPKIFHIKLALNPTLGQWIALKFSPKSFLRGKWGFALKILSFGFDGCCDFQFLVIRKAGVNQYKFTSYMVCQTKLMLQACPAL